MKKGGFLEFLFVSDVVDYSGKKKSLRNRLIDKLKPNDIALSTDKAVIQGNTYEIREDKHGWSIWKNDGFQMRAMNKKMADNILKIYVERGFGRYV